MHVGVISVGRFGRLCVLVLVSTDYYGSAVLVCGAAVWVSEEDPTANLWLQLLVKL